MLELEREAKRVFEENPVYQNDLVEKDGDFVVMMVESFCLSFFDKLLGRRSRGGSKQ